jgi:DNA-binding CsgD family transcriptional regulator
MINEHKNTEITPLPIMAGVMPNDGNIEFIGIRETKEVLWMCHGSSRRFPDLPQTIFNLLVKAYRNDENAVRFLSGINVNEFRKIELYTYYMYGAVDSTPDICNGVLAAAENFRDKKECPSLLWNGKDITIGTHVLSSRQLIIVDAIREDLPNKAISSLLGITLSTLDFHIRNLYQAVGVQTKSALLAKAFQNQIIH